MFFFLKKNNENNKIELYFMIIFQEINKQTTNKQISEEI